MYKNIGPPIGPPGYRPSCWTSCRALIVQKKYVKGSFQRTIPHREEYLCFWILYYTWYRITWIGLENGICIGFPFPRCEMYDYLHGNDGQINITYAFRCRWKQIFEILHCRTTIEEKHTDVIYLDSKSSILSPRSQHVLIKNSSSFHNSHVCLLLQCILTVPPMQKANFRFPEHEFPNTNVKPIQYQVTQIYTYIYICVYMCIQTRCIEFYTK